MNRKQITLALVSGLLYVFSFAPWDFSHLQWVAFVPLLIAIRSNPQTHLSWKNILKLGMITQAVICLGGFYWIAYAVHNYGNIPLPLASLVLLLFACIGQLQIPTYLLLSSALISSAHRKINLPVVRVLTTPLFAALLYTGLEVMLPKLFSDTAGHAFYNATWTRQGAEIGGVFFLTFASLFINESLAHAWLTKSKKALIPAGLFLVALQSFGYLRSQQVMRFMQDAEAQPRAEQLKIAMIQANIGDYLKVASENGSSSAANHVMTSYLQLSDKAMNDHPDLDVLIWPETAYPFLFGNAEGSVEISAEIKLRALVEKFKGTFIFGGYDHSRDTGLDYNSIFYLKQKQPLQTYHKSKLLMFGETLPGVELFPSAKALFPMMGFFGRGPGAEVISITNQSGITFQSAPSICYEGLFPELSTDAVKLGADFFLNVTNDSWFGRYGEPSLHLALTIFRSIENRKYFLRSTNTGYSVLINPLGQITNQSKLFEEEVIYSQIPKANVERMIPAIIHSVFERLCLLALLVALLLVIKTRPTVKHGRT